MAEIIKTAKDMESVFASVVMTILKQNQLGRV